MSDYKILHKRELGEDTWEVFHKGKPLIYFSPEIRDRWDDLAQNPYHSLENAKAIIEAHKDHRSWVEKTRKSDTVEWLDEEGQPLSRPPKRMDILPIENSNTQKIESAGWLCVLGILLVVLILIGFFI